MGWPSNRHVQRLVDGRAQAVREREGRRDHEQHPANRTASVLRAPAPLRPYRRSHSSGATDRLNAEPRANTAITPAPCNGPEASAATISADCSRPQGIAPQHAPMAPARAVAGMRATKRSGRASIRRLPWRPAPANQAGARPVASSHRPPAPAPTCSRVQTGLSAGAAAPRLASPATLAATSAPAAAQLTRRPT